MNRKKHPIPKNLIFLIMFVILVLFLYYSNIGCPILSITGCACPGCGMTRAYLSLITLHPLCAFSYHPLWWIVPLIPAIYLLYDKNKISKKIFHAILIFIIIIFLVVYIVRLLNPQDQIVIIDLNQNIFVKSFRFLLSLFHSH